MQIQQLLIGLVGLLSVLMMVGIACLVRFGSQLRKTDQLVEQLRAQMNVFDDGSQGLGRRLIEVDRQLQSIIAGQAGQPQSAMQAADAGQFAEAESMIKQGVSIDDIIERTGMSAAEVELLMLVNEKQTQPSPR